MGYQNQHGLSRDIPDPIRRQVRQACGFGCVICGGSIIDYEHVDPEFKDAAEHDPKNIVLLCPGCHAKVTRGMWSKDKVKEAMASPKCLSQGFANEMFDFGVAFPAVTFAGNTLTNCPIPIAVGGVPLFHIQPAEMIHAPFRLSANFFNSAGKPSLSIQDNEWHVSTSNWDVECTGKSIVVRDSAGVVSLKLVTDPPRGLIVETVNMLLGGYHFLGNAKQLEITSPVGGKMRFAGSLMDHCRIGFNL